MTQDLVLCSGVPAHLWGRERGLLHIPGHHTCLMGVSRQHLDLFKQSHWLGQVPYFKSIVMSKFIIVFNWALLNFCESS